MKNKLNLKKGDIIVVFNSNFIEKENKKESTIDFFKIYHPLIISNYDENFMYIQFSSLVKVEIDNKVNLDWELDEGSSSGPCIWERSIYNSMESFLGHELADKGQLMSYSYIINDETNTIWDRLVNLWKNEKNSNELIERTIKILDEDTNKLGSFLKWETRL